MIEPNHSKISVQRQCELVSLPRSSYYRQPGDGQETAENLVLRALEKILCPNNLWPIAYLFSRIRATKSQGIVGRGTNITLERHR